MAAEHRGDIHGGGHWKEKGKKPKDFHSRIFKNTVVVIAPGGASMGGRNCARGRFKSCNGRS